jgi:predicted MPP superfamily phosphohydrolase
VGNEETKNVPQVFGLLWCVGGVLSQVFLSKRIKVPSYLNYFLATFLTGLWIITDPKTLPRLWAHGRAADLREWTGALIGGWWLCSIGAAVILLLLSRRRKPVTAGRRNFLIASTAAACAAPAAVLGAGVIFRKDVHINEMDLGFPNLPKDLEGLRLLQLSDIHLGTFFTVDDLRRVVDASNNLRPDLAFITGDLITTRADPLDRCLIELRRLRAASGIWGCLGNHEFYSKLEQYTKEKAHELDIEFLRQEARILKFGNSQLNLAGVDYRPWENLKNTEALVSQEGFNLLLAHTPEVFPEAAAKGFDLMLSGHTHGGQINLNLFGKNLNIADLHTPYTKGLYKLPTSTVYVNSGLGTIGLPVRLGAPPEITLIRLCNS